MIHWPSYNQSLVRRGEILFSYDFLDSWDVDLARMNENKNGKKYKFPDSFILIIGYIRIYFHLPYRQTEGIIKATIGKNHSDHPCYPQICRRINKLDIDINNSIDDDDDDVVIIIAADIQVSRLQTEVNGCKINGKQEKRGYLKIHVAVNIKTKEILALEVTDEKVHDRK